VLHCVESGARRNVLVADDYDTRRKAQIRGAIIRHLRRYPNAGDTSTGILGAWLPSAGYEDAVHFIAAVLETMVADGELSPHDLPDGSMLYVRGNGQFAEEEPTKR
jgi:hypothetical protein